MLLVTLKAVVTVSKASEHRYNPQVPASDVDLVVKGFIEQMAETLSTGGRIEIRGFGSFSVRRRESTLRRNPKTGAAVQVAAHYATHFKPGKELRERVMKP